MKMVSYWKNTKEIYNDDGMVLIIGLYDHKNQHGSGEKCLGVHWGTYPQSHNILSPCVIPKQTRSAILSELLLQAVNNGNTDLVKEITDAIGYFNEAT